MPQIPFFAKEWREFRGLKIAEAARLMGIKISELSSLEARARHFDEHDLAMLSNAYDMNPAMLLGLDPSDPTERADLARTIDAANDVSENGE